MKLSLRLGLAYGFLFACVLAVIGVSLFVTVRSTVSATITEGLSDVARIAAHHVNRIVWTRWELLERNVRILEQWATTVEPRFVAASSVALVSDYPQQPDTAVISLVEELERGVALSDTVDLLSTITEGEIAILQVIENGLVVVSSSGGSASERRRGYYWPESAALYRLITTGRQWVGRQFFDGHWYLCAYLPLSSSPDLYVRVAVRQVRIGILGRDLTDIDLGNGGFVYILDTSGNVVLDPISGSEEQPISVVPYARQIAFGRSGTIEYTIDRHYLAAYEFIDSMNWVVVVATSTDEAFREVEMITRVFLIMFSLAVLMAMGVSLLLGRQISRPVAEVARRFKEIADGEEVSAAVTVPARGSSEVRALVRDFNRYVHRTMELNELERREVALEFRQEQMKALQAQINPHFLHNTLETIRFLIEMNDPRAVGTVQTLSDLFRVSLANGERFTTLHAELQHASLYFDIQAVRYSRMLTLQRNVPEELLGESVMGFLLQPIVENAVVHGIVPKQRPGVVQINACTVNDDLRITVVDDGVGMDQSTLERVSDHRSMRASDRQDGIGLSNVHERLRLTFGTGYGISIESGRTVGTTVTLLMPRYPQR